MASDADRLRDAEAAGDAEALFELGAELDDSGDQDGSARAWLAAAQQGHLDAAINLRRLMHSERATAIAEFRR